MKIREVSVLVLFLAIAVAVPPVAAQSHQEKNLDRLEWTLRSTVGPKSLAAGVFSAGWGTAFNDPPEYGPHWSGFAKRYGIRLTGIGPSNAIEAGLGSFWHEDPRYDAVEKGGLSGRLRRAARLTFFARRPDGTTSPAYARYIGITGSNFLSNAWRVDSESSVADAFARTALGFAGRFVGNVFDEFVH